MQNRPSEFGLRVSDEQTDQVELARPPAFEDFEGFPDAPVLHRLRQVSNLTTDNVDPGKIETNTGRYMHRSVCGTYLAREC